MKKSLVEKFERHVILPKVSELTSKERLTKTQIKRDYTTQVEEERSLFTLCFFTVSLVKVVLINLNSCIIEINWEETTSRCGC